MKSVEECRNRAFEFDQLANETNHPSLRRRYADLASCYRLLADERERAIKKGELLPEDSPHKTIEGPS